MTAVAAKVVHRALDGSTVEIRVSPSNAASPLGEDGATSFAFYDVGSSRTGVIRREFSAGSSAFQRRVAGLDGVRLNERYTLPSGTLRAGSTVHKDPHTGVSDVFRLGVWEDRVSAFMYGGRQSDLVELFARFGFHHTPEGPWMRVLPGKRAALVRDQSHAPCIAKPIPTLGLLEVRRLHADFARPPAASLRTESESGDEVYVEHGGTGDMRVLLLGPTTMSRLYPHEGVSEARATTEASSLQITWLPAGERA